MHYIYVIQNKTNLKVYVGQTNKLKRRWGEHRSYAKSNRKKNHPLYNSMRKHGTANFSIQTIESFELIEDADEAEEFWIQFFQARKREFGYNIALGGASSGLSEETKQKLSQINSGEGNPFFGKTHTEESRLAISIARTGTTASEETRQKMSKGRQGEKNGMHSKTHTSEAKKKIADARREGMKSRKRDAKGRLVKDD